MLLAIAGILGVIYFFFLFDATVAVPPSASINAGGIERVNNFGLMTDRQNGIVISLTSLLIGVLLLTVHWVASNNRLPQERAIRDSEVSKQESGTGTDAVWSAEKLSSDPRTQWLRDCVRADREGKPRPAKPL